MSGLSVATHGFIRNIIWNNDKVLLVILQKVRSVY